MDVAVLLAAGTGTALATGLGAVPVFFLGRHTEALRPALWGLAAGTMGVVSIVGLLAPAIDEESLADAALGVAIGVAFMLAAKRYLRVHPVTLRGRDSDRVRSSFLVFAVLFVPAFRRALRSAPPTFAFAAGAMISLVVVELLPEALAGGPGSLEAYAPRRDRVG